jgi:alpha-1,4-digalacturonate transport system substrate-binding protein
VRSLLAVGAAASVLLVAACSSSSPSSASGSGSGKQPFAGHSITYLYFTNGPDLKATQTLIAKFDQQTGASVALDTVPYANLNETIQAQLSAGKPPAVVETTAPGQFGSDEIDLGQALGKSWVQSLSPSLVTAAEYNGKVVGLPNQLTVMAPIVNVDMFNKAGVPVPTINDTWTWPQLVATAEKVQAANHTPFALAIDHSGDRLANVFAQYGTYVFGADGKGTWNSGQATQAMSLLAGLLQRNEISKAAWIAAGQKYAAGDVQFLAEQAPVLLSGSWEVASFATSAPFKWTAVPNPCQVNCGGGSGGNYMVAFKGSNDPALAEAFIKFMSLPANQSYMSVQSDTIPSSAALANPGSITYPGTVSASMDIFNKAATLMPAAFTLSEANPAYTTTTNTLRDQLTDVVAGKESVGQAVAAVGAAATAANAKNG